MAHDARSVGPVVEEPVAAARPALPHADWADCYGVDLQRGAVSSEAFARAMVEDPPPWGRRLLSLRNALVRPFGLSTGGAPGPDVANGFPILSRAENETVLGFDDTHLDFRVVVSVDGRGADAARVRVTTLVRRHGVAGRLYLACVLPVHRRIVPAMMRRAACVIMAGEAEPDPSA